METIEILQICWFFLIGILFTGYSVLDGFDLGIGSLMPFLARADEKKELILINSIGPVWDGNKVWLITAGGALFAAFPHAYATVFSGFYMAMMLVLFGLIFRAVSMKFYTLEPERRRLWSFAFFLGSTIPAILFGVALGNVIVGVPLDSAMEFRGNFFTLLRPFPLIIGLLGFTAILMQGAVYAALKTEDELQQDARSAATKILYAYFAMLVAAIIASFIFMPQNMGILPAWISTAITLVALFMLKKSIAEGKDFKSFVYSSLAFLSLWGIAGSVQFPNLVEATGGSDLNITIYNASSGILTLSIMLGIALIGMPVVIAYSIYVYRIFRGKVTLNS